MVSAQESELPERWVTPKILEWARERVGLSLDQASSKAKLSGLQIRTWETGKESPSLSDLEKLGELYDCPVGYFFLKCPPKDEFDRLDFSGIAPEEHDHSDSLQPRVPENLSYNSRLSLRQFVRLVDYASSLIKTTNIDWRPSLGRASPEDRVDKVVTTIVGNLSVTPETRYKRWSPEAAFNSWRRAIERQGIFVISLRFDPGELRGASLWDSANSPAILVNHAEVETATGRTFTLLHEYAHLLVRHDGMVCDFRGQGNGAEIEHFANGLAARSLVLRMESERLVDKLRPSLHASRDTTAILLEEMLLAPQAFYSHKRTARDSRKLLWRLGGWGRRSAKAQQRLREIGLNLALLLAYADQCDAIPKLDLAEILDMKVEEAESFVAWVRKLK